MYRDLKPSNILLASDGHCLLCDFGLAGKIKEKLVENSSTDTTETSLDDVMSTSDASSIAGSNETSSGSFGILKRRQRSTNMNSPGNVSSPTTPTCTAPTTAQVSRSGSRDSPTEEAKDAVNFNGEGETREEFSPATLARRIRRKTSCGTVGYRSPEIVRERNLKYNERKGYDEAIDWFSLGVTAYVLSCAKKPFENKSNYSSETMGLFDPKTLASDAIEMVPPNLDGSKKPSAAANFEFKSLMGRISYGNEFSDDMVDFCEHLLKRNPDHRMTYNSLITHPLVSDVNFLDSKALKAR